MLVPSAWTSLAQVLVLLLAVVGVAHAEPTDVPDELVPWVAWVLHDHPESACATVDGVPACVWPTRLTVDASADTGCFDLDVQVDAESLVALPGGRGAWPQDVRADGIPAVVTDDQGAPAVLLGPGRHRVTGAFAWSERPQGLAVPDSTGHLELTVDGEPVPWPQVDAGLLRLGAAEVQVGAGERLELDVYRRIDDGIPVQVTTRIHLRAAGRAREVDLGVVALEDTRAVELVSELPAHFTAEGHLVLQIRPGTWEVQFTTVDHDPVRTLSAPSPPAPWPEREVWVVQVDDRIRSVNLTGQPAVDPARTSLPEDWHGLPTFLVTPGGTLDLEELRRGEPQPPPNQLSLERTLWLDSTGDGYTVQDRFTGRLHQGWRLDLLPPGELGHVQTADTDQLITAGPRGAGVELRQAQVDLTAESRLPTGPALPAVGWDTDVSKLSMTVHLPPGHRMLLATGADDVEGALLGLWSVFDALLVLLVGLALGSLFGWPWAVLAVVALVLNHHHPGAPTSLWFLLAAVTALARHLPSERWRRLAEGLRWGVVALLFLVLVPFGIGQLEEGLYPAQARPWASAPTDDVPATPPQATTSRSLTVPDDLSPRAPPMEGLESPWLSRQQDPVAAVQTGPGVPAWQWDTVRLRWDSPVPREHGVTLVTLGPLQNLFLAVLRVSLLLALALRVSGLQDLRATSLARLARVAAMLVVGLLASDAARAAPNPELLRQLEDRLTEAPPCRPACVTVPHLSLTAGEDLTVLAEVHAGEASSWPLPGPADTWSPDLVLVDGRPGALARRDGQLHVRVPPGVSQVRASGPLPPVDTLTLQLGLAPMALSWQSESWSLDGLRADGSVEHSLQLTRSAATTTGASSTENLRPWLEVHRELDLGLPRRVRTTVLRRGPTDRPLTVRVPLLDGEAVTDAGHEVQGSEVVLTLDRGEHEATWTSTLEPSDDIVLSAPTDVPWSEEWVVTCSPVFSCSTTGPAPIRHEHAERWSPAWRPLPGETVHVHTERLPPVAGATATLDQAHLTLRPSRRLCVGTLDLEIRSSQGGQQVVRLPPGAELQEVRIDGDLRPLQATDGTVGIPLRPGA